MVQQKIEKQDFYGEHGCCLTCLEANKENMEGLQRQVWFNGKYYDCVCFNCKCTKCSWYYRGQCQRKDLEEVTF